MSELELKYVTSFLGARVSLAIKQKERLVFGSGRTCKQPDVGGWWWCVWSRGEGMINSLEGRQHLEGVLRNPSEFSKSGKRECSRPGSTFLKGWKQERTGDAMRPVCGRSRRSEHMREGTGLPAFSTGWPTGSQFGQLGRGWFNQIKHPKQERLEKVMNLISDMLKWKYP